MTTEPREHAVSLQLPTFWEKQPDIWFFQAEAEFELRNVTADSTKYAYLVKALGQDTAARLRDILAHPPTEGKYKNMKTRLLDTFGRSREARASDLLHTGPLGDRKPSELMDEMLATLGDEPMNFLFEQLFLDRMPEPIRLQISDGNPFEDPRATAVRADKLMCRLEKDTGRQQSREKAHRTSIRHHLFSTTPSSALRPTSVANPAPTRETRQPTVRSGHGRHIKRPPVIRLGPEFRTPFSSRFGSTGECPSSLQLRQTNEATWQQPSRSQRIRYRHVWHTQRPHCTLALVVSTGSS